MATKKQPVEIEGLDDAGVEPRVYELGFHLDPELAQEDLKKAYQDMRGRVEAAGTIIAEGEPVKIPLAYTISRMETGGRRDFSTAFFCWIAYETDGAGHEAVATAAREDSRIVRFLDIRTTVEEAKHSAEMQEMFEKASAEAMGEESVEVEAPAAESAPAEEAA
jgi:ribosomal protein S6